MAADLDLVERPQPLSRVRRDLPAVDAGGVAAGIDRCQGSARPTVAVFRGSRAPIRWRRAIPAIGTDPVLPIAARILPDRTQTMPPSDDRVILHLDMDAFYAAVEVRDDPGLAGKPLIVGHRGRRGVVATCSYEARRFGVRSAMPSVTAERLCPQAVWVHARMERYVEVSRRISRILEEATPVIEPLSIDEAFLDLTGVAAALDPAGPLTARLRPVADLEDGRRVAARLKQRIRDQEGLTASVGIAPNKYLAKVASDLEKPDGLVLLPREAIATRLWPLPVTRLWGVGPKTAPRLEQAGLRTIGDVARAGLPRLVPLVGGNFAAHIDALAHGLDDRPVEAGRRTKSISEERTYAEDLRDPD